MKIICWFQVILLDFCFIFFFRSSITCILKFEPEKFAIISIPSLPNRDSTWGFQVGIPHGDSKVHWRKTRIIHWQLHWQKCEVIQSDKLWRWSMYKGFHKGFHGGFHVGFRRGFHGGFHQAIRVSIRDFNRDSMGDSIRPSEIPSGIPTGIPWGISSGHQRFHQGFQQGLRLIHYLSLWVTMSEYA